MGPMSSGLTVCTSLSALFTVHSKIDGLHLVLVRPQKSSAIGASSIAQISLCGQQDISLS